MLLDLFLKHILHDHLNAIDEVTNIYSNVIHKEIDPAAIAHTSSCFSPATMSGEYELFNVDSVPFSPKSAEQIIFEERKFKGKFSYLLITAIIFSQQPFIKWIGVLKTLQ